MSAVPFYAAFDFTAEEHLPEFECGIHGDGFLVLGFGESESRAVDFLKVGWIAGKAFAEGGDMGGLFGDGVVALSLGVVDWAG